MSGEGNLSQVMPGQEGHLQLLMEACHEGANDHRALLVSTAHPFQSGCRRVPVVHNRLSAFTCVYHSAHPGCKQCE